MRIVRNYVVTLLIIAILALSLANATGPVTAHMAVSEIAVNPVLEPSALPAWTWRSFGESASAGAIAGFSGGIISGLVGGTVFGAAVGSVAAASALGGLGALGGALGGALCYAVHWGFRGGRERLDPQRTSIAYPTRVLD